jgi:NCS1 family nucleobase:cation symporter-1
VLLGVLPKLIADLGYFDISWIGNYTWFIGCGLGFVAFWWLERLSPQIPSFDGVTEGVADGAAGTKA